MTRSTKGTHKNKAHLKKTPLNPITEKFLGDKRGTSYLPGNFSIITYKVGFAIKMVKQPRIYIKSHQAAFIAKMIRDGRELFTMEEAKRIIAKEIVEAL